ncbi:MAG: hypothetical protein JXA74_12945 [Anaerolineae bacterium]|nr:hypothetical protein [Anaerolineae bacterium]
MEVEAAVKQRAAELFGVDPAAMQSLGGMDGAVYAAQRALRPIVIKIQPLPDGDPGETLTIIDFDVCAYHWFATDIGIALFHALWMRLPTRMETPTEFALRFLRHLMRGYRAEHALGTEWLLRLPIFVDYRRLLMHTVFSHEWSPNPAPWQAKMLQTWRTGILRGRPTIPLPAAELLTV